MQVGIYVQFLSGDTKAASLTLQHILDDVDATCADACLLMAQFVVQQGHLPVGCTESRSRA